MKNQIFKMICLSLATLYLSACSKQDPVSKPEITDDTSVTVETTTVAATETENSSEVNPDDFYATSSR